jgi:hypothetical protein
MNDQPKSDVKLPVIKLAIVSIGIAIGIEIENVAI